MCFTEDAFLQCVVYRTGKYISQYTICEKDTRIYKEFSINLTSLIILVSRCIRSKKELNDSLNPVADALTS